MTPELILKKYWDGNLPINLEKISSHLCIAITHVLYEAETTVCRLQMVKDMTTIYVNITKSSTQQRFGIAHQIGHVLLKHCFAGNEHIELVDNFRLDQSNEQEKQANEFAISLLVPETILKYCILEKKITKIESLANIFNVSQNLILHKIKEIGIIT